jgi:hypothetical protein
MMNRRKQAPFGISGGEVDGLTDTVIRDDFCQTHTSICRFLCKGVDAGGAFHGLCLCLGIFTGGYDDGAVAAGDL